MMNKIIIFLLFYCSSLCYGFRAIQVPESCAGEKIPCLIKTQTKNFKFKYAGYEYKLQPHSLLKLQLDHNVLQLNLLNGHMTINREDQASERPPLALNSVIMSSETLFVSRQQEILRIFDGESYFMTTFKMEQSEKGQSHYALKVAHTFLNKKDLIGFVKNHFVHVADLKSYLNRIENDWKLAFEQQNQLQTKALMRSIASEEEKALQEALIRQKEEEQRKKNRSKLFYRTFER